MKTTKFLFSVFTVLFVVFFIASCGEDENTESCDSIDVEGELNCPADISTVATFCSDGVNKSYYTYGGEKYYCEGVDASTCQAANDTIASKLIENGCKTSKSGSLKNVKIRLNTLAEKLLIEVRENSLCRE